MPALGRRWIIELVVVGVLALALSSSTLAGGELDPSFGGDGKVTTAFPDGAHANAVAVQDDGMIVVVGTGGDGLSTSQGIAVARYRPDGSLDPTFSTDGVLVTSIGGGFDEALAVAIDAEGRLVVAGHDDEARFALARYTEDGTLDATFGGDGIVTTDFTPGTDIAQGIAIQPDGRIVVAGRSGSRVSHVTVARYRPDGSLDATFGGGDGMVRTRTGDWGDGRAVGLRPDRKIVLAGWSQPGPSFALVRYRKDGSLDPAFGGGDGRVAARPSPAGYPVPAIGATMAIGADGRIVVGGVQDIFRFAVARFRPDGRLDRTFGGDGWVATSVGPGEHDVRGLVLRPTGKIVAIGNVSPHEYGDDVVPRMVVVRYTAQGRLDRSFGANGKVVTRFAGGAFAHGAATLPDGRIVVVGGAGPAPRFAVACYLR